MDVKAKVYIKHGGKWYKTGEQFTVKREDGEVLVTKGLVVETELSAEKHKAALAKQQADAEVKKAKADAAKKKAAEEAKAKDEKADKKGK